MKINPRIEIVPVMGGFRLTVPDALPLTLSHLEAEALGNYIVDVLAAVRQQARNVRQETGKPPRCPVPRKDDAEYTGFVAIQQPVFGT